MKMTIRIRNYGDLTVELWPEIAPIACAKVEKIANLGRYNGRRVERFEPGFVFQPLFFDGTDPVMDEKIELEAKSNPANRTIRFQRGTVAMAGTETKASAAQYFITLQPKERLNGNFTVIGGISDGWQVLEAIEKAPVVEGRLGEDEFTYHYPAEDIIIDRVTVSH